MSQSNDNSTDNELATIEDDCATEEQIDSVDRSDSVATVILVIDDDERCVSSGPITPPGSTNDVLIYEDQIVSYSPAIADCPFNDLSETFQLEIDDNGEGETTFESPEDPEKRNLLERRTRERELLKKCLQSCQLLRKDLLSFHSKTKEIHQQLLRT